jgi:hypothetical protein
MIFKVIVARAETEVEMRTQQKKEGPHGGSNIRNASLETGKGRI